MRRIRQRARWPDQTNDTIERKKTIGSEHNTTSVCVSDQLRRIAPRALHERFMSRLQGTRKPDRQGTALRSRLRFQPAPLGGLGRIAPGDLAEESNMHTPCQSLPAARKFMEIRCKSFTEKALRHISTLVALALRPGGVERIAPVPWSLATTSGANRSTPTPQWWHAPFAALTGMASQPVSRPPGPRGRGPRRCRPRVPPGQPGRGAQTAAGRRGPFYPGS